MNRFITALIKSMSSEELEQLGHLVESELELRFNILECASASKCDCGGGYCPTDNLHYPCVCEELMEDDLPF